MARIALTALLLGLVACAPDPGPATQLAPISGLQTLRVAQGEGTAAAWDGVVEAVRQAELSAQTSGRVLAVNADVNDVVAEGELLVRISAVEQRAGVDSATAALAAAEAALLEAAATRRRFDELAGKQFVSKAQLDQVRAAHDAAIAARNAARAQLAQARQQSDYTTVRAPFAGLVASRAVEPGESVAPGQPLLSLFDPQALRIEVDLPQRLAEAVRALPQAQLKLADGRSSAASSVTVYPAADASAHSIRIRLQLTALDPPPRPGSTAKVSFAALAGQALPQIPRSALLRRGELDAVYVLSEGRLSLRQLRLGRQTGEQVEVIAGLQGGEEIAADPLAALEALRLARAGAN